MMAMDLSEKLYFSKSLFIASSLDTEYFQLKAWFKQVLQHLFTRNHSLNNAFKQMQSYSATSSVSDFEWA